MAQHVNLSASDRREPRGPGSSVYGLLFALFGAPLAWLAELSFNVAWASYPFVRTGTLYSSAPITETGDRIVLFVANIMAIAVALLAAWTARAAWSGADGADDVEGVASGLVVTRLTRTRYLALWGLLNGAIFTVALVFDTVMLIGTPPAC